MRREPPFLIDHAESEYESYCDSREMGMQHSTLQGFFGETVADEYQERYRKEYFAKHPEPWDNPVCGFVAPSRYVDED